MCVFCACRGQRLTLEPLELKLQVVLRLGVVLGAAGGSSEEQPMFMLSR